MILAIAVQPDLDIRGSKLNPFDVQRPGHAVAFHLPPVAASHEFLGRRALANARHLNTIMMNVTRLTCMEAVKHPSPSPIFDLCNSGRFLRQGLEG